MPRVVDGSKLVFGESLNEWVSDYGCKFSGIAVYDGNEPMPFEGKPYEVIFNLNDKGKFNQGQVDIVLETFAPLGFSDKLFIKYQYGEDVMLVPAMSRVEQRASAITFSSFPADSVVGFTLHASAEDLHTLTFNKVPDLDDVIRKAMTMGDKGALKKQAVATDADSQPEAAAKALSSANSCRMLPRQQRVSDDHAPAPASLSPHGGSGGTVAGGTHRDVVEK